MDWTEIYRDAVTGKDILLVRADPPEGIIDLSTVKACRVIPCPGSYFPYHDDWCEMVWDGENEVFTECDCEPRARKAYEDWKNGEAVDG